MLDHNFKPVMLIGFLALFRNEWYAVVGRGLSFSDDSECHLLVLNVLGQFGLAMATILCRN